MNFYKKASLVAAGVALSVSPVAASAAQATTTGLTTAEYANARMSASIADANEVEGGSGIILAILAAAAIIAGIIIAADGSENTPTSP